MASQPASGLVLPKGMVSPLDVMAEGPPTYQCSKCGKREQVPTMDGVRSLMGDAMQRLPAHVLSEMRALSQDVPLCCDEKMLLQASERERAIPGLIEAVRMSSEGPERATALRQLHMTVLGPRYRKPALDAGALEALAPLIVTKAEDAVGDRLAQSHAVLSCFARLAEHVDEALDARRADLMMPHIPALLAVVRAFPTQQYQIVPATEVLASVAISDGVRKLLVKHEGISLLKQLLSTPSQFPEVRQCAAEALKNVCASESFWIPVARERGTRMLADAVRDASLPRRARAAAAVALQNVTRLRMIAEAAYQSGELVPFLVETTGTVEVGLADPEPDKDATTASQLCLIAGRTLKLSGLAADEFVRAGYVPVLLQLLKATMYPVTRLESVAVLAQLCTACVAARAAVAADSQWRPLMKRVIQNADKTDYDPNTRKFAEQVIASIDGENAGDAGAADVAALSVAEPTDTEPAEQSPVAAAAAADASDQPSMADTLD